MAQGKARVSHGAGSGPRSREVKGDGKTIPPGAQPGMARAAARGSARYNRETPIKAEAAPLMSAFPELADVLPALCEEYRQLAKDAGWIEKRKKALGAEIMPLMEAVDCDVIAADDRSWTVYRSEGCNVSISKERLLELGVSMAIIEKATKRTPYFYVQVRGSADEETNVRDARVGR
jgi:hypothetical protein